MKDLTNVENYMLNEEYWRIFEESFDQEYDPSHEEYDSDEWDYPEYIPLKDSSDDR